MTRRSLQTLIGSFVGMTILLSVSNIALAATPKDTTPPGDVEKLTAIVGDGMVSLSWDAATDDTGVTGYNVYVGPDEVTATNTAKYAESKKLENVTTYDVKKLENGKTYYMAVTALDAAGNESESYSPYVTVKPFSKVVAAVNGVDTTTTTTSVAKDVPKDAPKEVAKTSDVVAAAPAAGGADTTAPTVKSAEAVYKGQVKVIFSEPIKLPLVKPERAFMVQDNIVYDKLVVNSASMDPSDKTNSTVLLDTDDQNPNSDYVVTASSDIEDLAGNPISSGTSDAGQFKGSAITLETYLKAHPAAPAADAAVPAPATTNPLVPAANASTEAPKDALKIDKLEIKDDTTLKITFTKPVVLSINPTENFVISKKGDANALLSLSSIAIDEAKTSVVITATMEPGASYTLTMAGILDDKGVEMTKENSTFDFVSTAATVVKDVTPPEDVTNFVAKAVKTLAAKLSWTGSKNSAGDLLEYIVYRSMDGKKYGQITSLSKENTAYEIQELEPGYHYYKVTSKDANGNESKGKTVALRLSETGPEVGLLALMSVGLGRVFGRKKQKKSKI